MVSRYTIPNGANCIAGVIALHEISAADLRTDRAVNLPAQSYTPAQMIDALKHVAADNDITLDPITAAPDAAIQSIVDSWPRRMKAVRTQQPGLLEDQSLDDVIQDYIDRFEI